MISQILMSSYGGIGAVLPSAIVVTDRRIHPNASTASFTLNAAGTYTSVGNVIAPTGTWALYGGATDYQFRLTVITGTFSGASTGVWVGPSASPTWSLSIPVNTFNDLTSEGLLEIRDNATLAVLASATLTLNATESA